MKKLLISTLLFSQSLIFPFIVNHSIEKENDHTITLSIPITLEPHELVQEQHIIVSVDHPDITLKNWIIDKKPILSYSPIQKEHLMVYDQPFIITAFIKKNNNETIPDGSLHSTLASSTHSEPEETVIPITFPDNNAHLLTPPAHFLTEESTSTPDVSTVSSPKQKSFLTKLTEFSYKDIIKKTLLETDSLALQLLLAFILGLLLSLTPCIYPMIPITLGVLQSQAQTSLLRNFFIALCYTVGLAITFSLMGLLAASSGQAFGYLMANPIFVICIVIFLCYFAFSLFGFYSLYIPRFMQNKGSVSNSGSATSAFFFGMASGSVASPCVSPGLALILTIVAALGSKVLGFLLLFAFGFGISTPLLILGTFSGSINLLPKAGMWMLEIQKIFGFMLLGMAIYYLNNILPFYITMGLITILFAVMGIHYFYSIKNEDTFFWKSLKNIIGFIAIVTAVMTSIQTFEAWYHPKEALSFESTWYTNYQEAIEEAKKTNKLLFIDTWTPYCSICKGITNKLLKSGPVSEVLKEHYVILSVDASDAFTEPYATVKKQFKVVGVPYLLVIDPTTEKEITHWQSEMYDMTVEQVKKLFTDLTAQENQSEAS